MLVGERDISTQCRIQVAVSSRSCIPEGTDEVLTPHFLPSSDTLHKICHHIQISPERESGGLEASEGGREGGRLVEQHHEPAHCFQLSSLFHRTLTCAPGTHRVRLLLSSDPTHGLSSGYSGYYFFAHFAGAWKTFKASRVEDARCVQRGEPLDGLLLFLFHKQP